MISLITVVSASVCCLLYNGPDGFAIMIVNDGLQDKTPEDYWNSLLFK